MLPPLRARATGTSERFRWYLRGCRKRARLPAVRAAHAHPQVSKARFLLRRNELVTDQLARWWEMLAGDKGSINFTEYIALQLVLHKVLVAPPFDRAAAEVEAEESWAYECPQGGRLMSRHLIQDSLFDLVDQRTRSTTPEECAEFLDLLFGVVTAGSPPSLKKPQLLEHYDIAAQAVSNAGSAIRRRLKEESDYAASAAKAVGKTPLLVLSTPPHKAASDGHGGGGDRTREQFASGASSTFHTPRQQSSSLDWGMASSGSSTIPFAFDSRSAPPYSHRKPRQLHEQQQPPTPPPRTDPVGRSPALSHHYELGKRRRASR